MGILDGIIKSSPFLKNTQGMFNPQQPPMQPMTPAMPQVAPQQPQQQGGQQGGVDMSTIMKIMSMFGGM